MKEERLQNTTNFSVIEIDSGGRVSNEIDNFLLRTGLNHLKGDSGISISFNDVKLYAADADPFVSLEVSGKILTSTGTNSNYNVIDYIKMDVDDALLTMQQAVHDLSFAVFDGGLSKTTKELEFQRDLAWYDYYEKYFKWEDTPESDYARKQELEIEFTNAKKRADKFANEYDTFSNKLTKAGKILDVVGGSFGAIADVSDIANNWKLSKELDAINAENYDADIAPLKMSINAMQVTLGLSISVFAVEAVTAALLGLGVIASAPVTAPIFVVGAIGCSIAMWWQQNKINAKAAEIKGRYNARNENKPIVDPSGYIYEAVASNRIEGATVTCEKLVTCYDIYEEPYQVIETWNADDYGQMNPLTSTASGEYAWDVPVGTWRVKAEKEGYDTVYSDWMAVPPPQLDVNIGLVSHEAPAVKQISVYRDQVNIEFTKYMDAENLADAIAVMVNGSAVEGEFVLSNAEQAPGGDGMFVSKVRFVPSVRFEEGASVCVVVSQEANSYAGTALTSAFTGNYTASTRIEDLTADTQGRIIKGSESVFSISASPAEAAAGKTVKIRNGSSLMLQVKEESVVLDRYGRAEVHVTGLLLGMGVLTYEIEGSDLTAETVVTISQSLESGDETEEIILSTERKYILLTVGETEMLEAAVTPEKYASYISWSVEDDSNVISVSSSGLVVAKKAGTAYAVARVTTGQQVYSVRCRIDVTEQAPENAVSAVSVANPAVTVELYSTNYTEIEAVLEIAQNLSGSGRISSLSEKDSLQEKDDAGVAIDRAVFAPDAKGNVPPFDLLVKDDRTLVIIPKEGIVSESQKNSKLVSSSYTNQISITIGQKQLMTNPVKITVKKTLPSIKATAVKINSAIQGKVMPLVFTGGKVTGIKVSSVPSWLNVDCEKQTVSLKPGTASAKGDLSLLCTVEGWAVERAVKVSITAAKTQPKLTFTPSTVTLRPGTKDSVSLKTKITPAEFEGFEPVFSRITEGSKACNSNVLSCSCKDGMITVSANRTDGKAHTYKVYYKVNGTEFAFTVKTLEDAKPVKMTAKVAGAIDTSIPYSAAVITAGFQNYTAGNGEEYTVEIVRKNAKTKTEETVTEFFNVSTAKNVITITEKSAGSLAAYVKNYTYTATITAEINGDGASDASVSAKITMKASVAGSVKTTITLKPTGSIDVLRKGTAVKIVPTVKNGFNYTLSKDDLTFYKGTGKSAAILKDAPFHVEVEDNAYIVTVSDSEKINHTVKYSVRAAIRINGTQVLSGTASAPVTAFAVKQGSVKVNADPASVHLLIKDRHSTDVFRLTCADDTLNKIDAGRVTLDAASAKLFSLRAFDNGEYEISYKNETIPVDAKGKPAVKAGQSKTVKLNVFFEGNNSSKANCTVSLKVSIK